MAFVMGWPPTIPNYPEVMEHGYRKPSPRDDIEYYKTYHKIECEIEITDKDDLGKLLFMASNGNRVAFVDRLCVMAFKKHGNCAQYGTRFIFPSSLSVKERQSIHKMQATSSVRFYETYTYVENGERKLNLFIKI
jgi:hypothetical protein